jgi:hypothetical protein
VAGLFAAPVKTVETVKVETKVVTVTEWKDRVVEKTVKGPVQIRTVTHQRPGGERIIERVVQRGPVTTDRATESTGQASATAESTSATSRVTESGRPGYRVGVGAGWDPGRLSLKPDVYQLDVSRRIAGTVWLGAYGRTDKTFGVNIALEF